MECIDGSTIFIFVDRMDSLSFSVLKATFGATHELVEYPFPAALNPLSLDSGYEIQSAIYIPTFKNSDPFQYLFYGQTQKIDLSPLGTVSQSQDHGYLFPLDTDVFESCFSSPSVTPSTTNPSETNTLYSWSIQDSSTFPLGNNNEWCLV